MPPAVVIQAATVVCSKASRLRAQLVRRREVRHSPAGAHRGNLRVLATSEPTVVGSAVLPANNSMAMGQLSAALSRPKTSCCLEGSPSRLWPKAASGKQRLCWKHTPES